MVFFLFFEQSFLVFFSYRKLHEVIFYNFFKGDPDPLLKKQLDPDPH